MEFFIRGMPRPEKRRRPRHMRMIEKMGFLASKDARAVSILLSFAPEKELIPYKCNDGETFVSPYYRWRQGNGNARKRDGEVQNLLISDVRNWAAAIGPLLDQMAAEDAETGDINGIAVLRRYARSDRGKVYETESRPFVFCHLILCLPDGQAVNDFDQLVASGQLSKLWRQTNPNGFVKVDGSYDRDEWLEYGDDWIGYLDQGDRDWFSGKTPLLLVPEAPTFISRPSGDDSPARGTAHRGRTGSTH